MFKRSRRKIVAAIMSVLLILWVGTLAMIYASSYAAMTRQNRELLREHVARYTLSPGDGQRPVGPPPNDRDEPYGAERPEFKLSTFYSVAMSYDGTILATENPDDPVYSEQELASMAQAVVRQGRDSGVWNDLIYCRADKGGYLLVAFMDNTILNGSMLTLFRYTLVFGGLAIVLLFFFAVYLARRIVQPLEESYHKQKQFISDAGHELKTPISVVNANAELLQRELGENQWLANIQYENERMRLLVGQLLELARAEQATVQQERLELSRLVTGEMLPFEAVAYERGLRISGEITPQLFVQGNGDQLRQLTAILIDNAISHSESGGCIVVRLRQSRTNVILSVANPGQPIAPEQQARLFERFYRSDASRASQQGHYGLGLAIAKAIVTAHHGHLDIRCQNGQVEFRTTFQRA